ncbi:MAG TPA: DnaJ C-terminal domain-containing protein, partial [Candidatus Thalassarchaeaceae archaeon]|nr:DnaJ C-terminal domain-containing protein [Candidatus Thalassarchaeaceae archaeon]
CDGRGRIDEISMIGPFRQRIRKDCNSCRGSGRIVTDPCTICKGEGRSFQSSKVNFLISPGVRDGTRLRIRSQGESSTSINGNPGDLFIELDLEPHPWFERDGPDLLMALPLSYADLSLGADIEIPHLDSQDLRISVPPGSRPGDTILIPDRGLPSHRGIQNRGSVTAVLKLAMPKKNSRKMRKKISEIRDEMEEELETLENRILLEAKKRRRS